VAEPETRAQQLVASQWANSTRKQRLPKNWLTLRRSILERDDHVCHVCHRTGASQVDHVIAGDNHDESNLAAIHEIPCHRDKTIREREAKRVTRKRPPERHPGQLTR
jgi:5-methylcytosine-specific restriction endonuclease McrA